MTKRIEKVTTAIRYVKSGNGSNSGKGNLREKGKGH
jgi:hypothetical protein